MQKKISGLSHIFLHVPYNSQRSLFDGYEYSIFF